MKPKLHINVPEAIEPWTSEHFVDLSPLRRAETSTLRMVSLLANVYDDCLPLDTNRCQLERYTWGIKNTQLSEQLYFEVVMSPEIVQIREVAVRNNYMEFEKAHISREERNALTCVAALHSNFDTRVNKGDRHIGLFIEKWRPRDREPKVKFDYTAPSVQVVQIGDVVWSMPLPELPTEIWERIIDQMPSGRWILHFRDIEVDERTESQRARHDLLACSLVCKSWKSRFLWYLY